MGHHHHHHHHHHQAVQEDDFGTGCCAPMQRHLWNLFENPDHSKAAKVNYQKNECAQNFQRNLKQQYNDNSNSSSCLLSQKKKKHQKPTRMVIQAVAVVSCLFVIVSTLCLI